MRGQLRILVNRLPALGGITRVCKCVVKYKFQSTSPLSLGERVGVKVIHAASLA